MGLMAKLQELGCQLKLVQTVRQTETSPVKIETKSVTLQELTTELKDDNVRLLAESPVELTIEFSKVFESAGIKIPNHGWTFEKFIEVFQSKYEKAPKAELKKAVLDWLADSKVSSEDLVRDAIARDQAIDAYEVYVFQKMEARNKARNSRVDTIKKEMDKLKQEQLRLEKEIQEDQHRLKQWQQRKENYEQEISRAIELLTNGKQ